MSFDEAFKKVIAHEGGYVDNQSDPGGRTKWGISQKAFPEVDIAAMTMDECKALYKKHYWDAIGIVNLPPDVQFTVFDAAVNSGPKQAAKWLQRSVNVIDDGVIGHITIHACNMLPAAVIVARFNGHRLDFFTRLKTWPVFGAGWSRRIATNLMET